ncbi:MAG: L,D-transpeptidase family protein [Alphaproteobacteria bacterium]|nr:L,D-transpeptidase family protein [Alphaproteobacteria bacterium]MCB9696808.1 L,D-transpeptidase family protein [Alphaproteobacteria bacterium]
MVGWVTLALANPDPPVIPPASTELVLTVVPTADASEGQLTRWTRGDSGAWARMGSAVRVRLGADGTAWGRGLHPAQPGRQKQEGDDRAPAGVFALGDAWGYAAGAPPTWTWPYHATGPRDLWVEDPGFPHYNEHLLVEGDRPLVDWEAASVMRARDPSHALKVFVAHNAPPDAVPGAGSAIFLHIWRDDGARATAGCTSMARPDLEELVGWLDPAAHPVYVLLPADDLARLGPTWGLPTP